MSRARLADEDPRAAAALEAIEAADVVVVPGCYDQVELVLDALGVPYQRVTAERLGHVALRPEQLLVVNCPGHVEARALPKIRRFVADGGRLFTTDWALRHVIEPCFPGLVAYNDRPTDDTVVRVTVADRNSPYLAGVMDGNDDPQWWLEGSSYPITVLDPERVEVLISSAELGRQWGEPAVAVRFTHGAGEVFHMISHYFLQRTELRDARHAAPAASYAAEKGVEVDNELAVMLDGLTVGEVESAATSARFLTNLLVGRDRGREGREPGPASSASSSASSSAGTAGGDARSSGPAGAGEGADPISRGTLFVYGHLAPGEPGHAAIEPFVGLRRLADVRGVPGDGDGPARFDAGAPTLVEGWLLGLRPSQRSEAMAVIDRLHGDDVRPTTVVTEDGVHCLAYEAR